MRSNTNDRCTEQDYRNLFATSADELRWLGYTLTGNDSLSEKVMDAALEQSLKGANQVFREWMQLGPAFDHSVLHRGGAADS